MFRKLVFGLVLAVLFATPAGAAILEVQGSASVDNGNGYAAAANKMQVSPGDRVRALHGCVLIVYENGYQTKLCSGRIAVVLADPPPRVRNGSFQEAPAAAADAPLPLSGLLVAGGITTVLIVEKNNPAGP